MESIFFNRLIIIIYYVLQYFIHTYTKGIRSRHTTRNEEYIYEIAIVTNVATATSRDTVLFDVNDGEDAVILSIQSWSEPQMRIFFSSSLDISLLVTSSVSFTAVVFFLEGNVMAASSESFLELSSDASMSVSVSLKESNKDAKGDFSSSVVASLLAVSLAAIPSPSVTASSKFALSITITR